MSIIYPEQLLDKPTVTIPSWLDANHAAFKGTIKDLPMRDEVTIPVEESMIVEYYSR